ncbi:NAD(P)/FAD-dependent oxidoreductase [Chondrinema litorale]|uniref:NAD(P)/FAD-dependent oxidoreductase n=1 Tax=Chondrinema litorale TaxID=2994555 RepID=UPI002543FAEB|nr:FAD-dependent oxidoreductase [Chondrinema litorale]UZR94077.1 FAD-dependent oxidoreductase [Chondrinema litorale]
MHIVIIGNGISGITAARHIRKKSDHRITVISAETDYFFSRTALMYVYMGHMKFEHTQPYENWFWEKNRIELVKNYVSEVNVQQKQIQFSDGKQMNYDKLIIATGSKPNKFGWPGQDLKGVQGMYSYQDLQGMETYSKDLKHAVIVGGGLIGVEMAEMFHSRHIPVTFLVREKSFWSGVLPAGESAIVNREIQSNGIDLRLNEELQEILPDANGRVKAIKTKSGEEIACQFVGLTAGVKPNIDFLKNTEIKKNRGVLVNHFLETSAQDVYAIGDCAEFTEALPGRKPVEQVWYTGRMHGETLAETICGKRTAYTPGPWFNSAKFFDIEYQTYGTVLSQNPEGQTSLYWEHQDGRKCIHIVYDKSNDVVKGINLFGIRHRHEVWDKWLKENKTLPYVLENLHEANFDPEMFDTYEKDVVNLYNQQNPNKPVKSKRKKRFLERLGF